uniref:OSJNBb0103I08.14 protein n=1 Tax=Oryza sativa subsp. japonica TaxID=39947 RepID=Q7XUI9_ORYSJ|nr:OSJNBb0103I08.14 [Oryza sativa Japonica Group]
MECQNLTLAAGEWVYIPPTTKTSRWNRNPQLCALPKASRYRAIIEPTQPGRSDRSVVAGQTVNGSVRPPSARSDRLRLWRLCIATKNQTSATDQWAGQTGFTTPVRPANRPGQTGLRPTVRPQVTFQLNRPLIKRRYLLTRVSEFGVLGLYGKLIQRAIQPMNNPSKKHNFSLGERAHTPKDTPPDITT